MEKPTRNLHVPGQHAGEWLLLDDRGSKGVCWSTGEAQWGSEKVHEDTRWCMRHVVTARRVHKITRSWVRSTAQVGESAWGCGRAWVVNEKWAQRDWRRCRWAMNFWGRQKGMLQISIMRALKVIKCKSIANHPDCNRVTVEMLGWPELRASHEHHLFSATETLNRHWINVNRSRITCKQNGRHRAQDWEYKII